MAKVRTYVPPPVTAVTDFAVPLPKASLSQRVAAAAAETKATAAVSSSALVLIDGRYVCCIPRHNRVMNFVSGSRKQRVVGPQLVAAMAKHEECKRSLISGGLLDLVESCLSRCGDKLTECERAVGRLLVQVYMNRVYDLCKSRQFTGVMGIHLSEIAITKWCVATRWMHNPRFPAAPHESPRDLHTREITDRVRVRISRVWLNELGCACDVGGAGSGTEKDDKYTVTLKTQEDLDAVFFAVGIRVNCFAELLSSTMLKNDASGFVNTQPGIRVGLNGIPVLAARAPCKTFNSYVADAIRFTIC